MRNLLCIVLALGMFAPLACNKEQPAPPPPPPTTNTAELQTAFDQALLDQEKKKQEQANLVVDVKRKQWSKAPDMAIDPTHAYVATISMEAGDIVIDLDPQNAPRTVNSFVFLARHNFFDGLKFHRVQSELIQGGDPLGNGTGGPGYAFPDEVMQNKLSFNIGSLAMANSGPDTNGSQFFICLKPTQWWDQWQGKYTIFGRVRTGMGVARGVKINDVMKTVTIAESSATQPTTRQ